MKKLKNKQTLINNNNNNKNNQHISYSSTTTLHQINTSSSYIKILKKHAVTAICLCKQINNNINYNYYI